MEFHSSLATYIRQKCTQWEGREFIQKCPSTSGILNSSYRYEDFYQLVLRVEAGLRQTGLQTGQTFLLAMENSVESLALFMGALSAGIIPVLVAPGINHKELQLIKKYSGAVQGILSKQKKQDNHTLSIPLISISDFYHSSSYQSTSKDKQFITKTNDQLFNTFDDTAYQVVTSGSTGRPKRVEISHKNILSEIHSMSDAYGFVAEDCHLGVLPFYHASGLYRSFFLPFHTGGRIVVEEKFVAETFWQSIEQENISFVQVVPSILKALLMNKGDFHPDAKRSLKGIGSASAPHPIELLKNFYHCFGIYVLVGYGMTEATCGITLQDLPYNTEKNLTQLMNKLGSVGRPLSVNQVQVLDDNKKTVPSGIVGHVVAKGDNLARWSIVGEDSDHHSGKDNMLATGDIGFIDEDGFIWLQARQQDMIKRAGFRMSTSEIEADIIQVFPDRDVVVLAIPHETLGQDVIAFITPGRETRSPREIIRALKGKMDSHKIPSEFLIVDTIPMMGVGKIDRKQLQTIYNSKKKQ